MISSDLRYAVRSLARRPALTVVTSVALTIGISANATMFGVVDQLMLQPPPGVHSPDRVRRIFFRQHQNGDLLAGSTTSYRAIAALRAVPSFSGVAVYSQTNLTMGRAEDMTRVSAMAVSQSYFPLLGVQPVLGRNFRPEEDRPPQGPLVAILSDGFWRRTYGGEPNVIGRSMVLDGKLFTIIGVAPAGFNGVDRFPVDLWVPMSAVTADRIGSDWATTSNSFWAQGIARVKPNEDIALAERQATTVYRNEIKSWKGILQDSMSTVALGSLAAAMTASGFSPEGKVALWLVGVSALVLLIACANVANLLIARTIERRREIAVRVALGASRGKVLRQLLIEAALLATVAAAAALIVTPMAAQFVQHVLLPAITWNGSVVDERVLLFTLLVSIVCILLAGLAPAIHAARTNVGQALKTSSRQIAGGSGRLRSALLGLQVSLSVVLLIGTGLFVRSLRHVVQHDVGITLDRVALVTFTDNWRHPSSAELSDLYKEARDRVAAMPGVERAALVSGTVPGRMATGFSDSLPGRKRIDLPGGGPYSAVAGDDFLLATGTNVVRGRGFTAAEEAEPSHVMLVNRVVADAYWPGEDPIGKCVLMGDDKSCTTVVGIVENVMLFKVVNDDRAMLYLPPSWSPHDQPSALVVRTRKKAVAMLPVLRRTLQALRPTMPYANVESYEQIVAPQLQPWRLGATMFGIFGTLALIIAAVGLYSVMAYWASQRVHEIGVRMALGAQRGDLVRLIGRQAGLTVGLGLIVGILVAAAISRWTTDLLYDTSPRELSVYVLAAVTLAVAAIIALLVPARRVTAVDPAIALRAE